MRRIEEYYDKADSKLKQSVKKSEFRDYYALRASVSFSRQEKTELRRCGRRFFSLIGFAE